MSVYYGEDFEEATELKDFAFYNAFNYNCWIKDISNLKLPAKTLGVRAYAGMFGTSTSDADKRTFTKAPALPATNLADSCYQSMFQNSSCFCLL